MYSVNDDKRIIEFLKKQTGGRKPVVSGWFFSHAHDDHICKLTDTVFVVTARDSSTTVYSNLSSTSNLAQVFTELLNSSIMRKNMKYASP